MPAIYLDDAVLDLPPLVSLDDLKKRYDVTDDDQATQTLEDASALIRMVANPADPDNMWADPTTCPNAVRVIVIRATERYLNNPQGLQSESYGSYNYAYAKDSTGGIWLTAGESAMIAKAGSRVKTMTSLSFYSPYLGHAGSGTIYSQPYNDPDPIPVWDATNPY